MLRHDYRIPSRVLFHDIARYIRRLVGIADLALTEKIHQG